MDNLYFYRDSNQNEVDVNCLCPNNYFSGVKVKKKEANNFPTSINLLNGFMLNQHLAQYTPYNLLKRAGNFRGKEWMTQ